MTGEVVFSIDGLTSDSCVATQYLSGGRRVDTVVGGHSVPLKFYCINQSYRFSFFIPLGYWDREFFIKRRSQLIEVLPQDTHIPSRLEEVRWIQEDSCYLGEVLLSTQEPLEEFDHGTHLSSILLETKAGYHPIKADVLFYQNAELSAFGRSNSDGVVNIGLDSGSYTAKIRSNLFDAWTQEVTING